MLRKLHVGCGLPKRHSHVSGAVIIGLGGTVGKVPLVLVIAQVCMGITRGGRFVLRGIIASRQEKVYTIYALPTAVGERNCSLGRCLPVGI